MKCKAIVCFLACAAMTCFAQDSSTSNKQSAQNQNSPAAIQSPIAQRSHWAVQTISLTDQARQAIAQQDQSTAKNDVSQALEKINKIESNPNNSASSSQNVDMVPIFAEFERSSFLQPVMMAQHKTAPSGEMASGNQQTSNSSNQQVAQNEKSQLPQSDRPEAVTQVDQGFTTISLNVNTAKSDLQKAKSDLAKNDTNSADQDLMGVQQAVTLQSAEMTRPLVRARENLGLAESAIQSQDYSEAKATLTAASRALENYARNNNSAQHASDAKQLGQQIKSFSQQIDNNHSDAGSKVSGWWNQIANWTQSAS